MAAGDHSASSTFEVDLNEGSVTHYPLDSYVARVDVQLLDGKSSLRLPARVTTWEGALGYGLHTTSQPGADPNDVQLTTTISRSGAFCPVRAMRLRRDAGARLLRACDRDPDICRRASRGSDLDRSARRNPFALPCCATRCPDRRRLGSRPTCGCFCGPNSRPCWRSRCWSSNGRNAGPRPEEDRPPADGHRPHVGLA